MAKNLTEKRPAAPKRLTDYEMEKINRAIELPDWQFDSLIRPNCILITELIIGPFFITDKEGKTRRSRNTAKIYGLVGLNKETNEREVANIFVRYGDFLYQVEIMSEAFEIIDLLRKEDRWNEYQEQITQRKIDEKKKSMKAA